MQSTPQRPSVCELNVLWANSESSTRYVEAFRLYLVRYVKTLFPTWIFRVLDGELRIFHAFCPSLRQISRLDMRKRSSQRDYFEFCALYRRTTVRYKIVAIQSRLAVLFQCVPVRPWTYSGTYSTLSSAYQSNLGLCWYALITHYCVSVRLIRLSRSSYHHREYHTMRSHRDYESLKRISPDDT